MPLPRDRHYQPIHYENGITIVDNFADYNPATDTVSVVPAGRSQIEIYFGYTTCRFKS